MLHDISGEHPEEVVHLVLHIVRVRDGAAHCLSDQFPVTPPQPMHGDTGGRLRCAQAFRDGRVPDFRPVLGERRAQGVEPLAPSGIVKLRFEPGKDIPQQGKRPAAFEERFRRRAVRGLQPVEGFGGIVDGYRRVAAASLLRGCPLPFAG